MFGIICLAFGLVWNLIVVLMENKICDSREHAFAIRKMSCILFIVYGNDATRAALDLMRMSFLINEVIYDIKVTSTSQ